VFFINMNGFTRPWVPPNSRIPLLDRKCAKAAQLNPIPLGHRAGDLVKNGIYDPFDVSLVQVRIVIRNLLDQF
jgi:hypothetical protein